MVAPTFRKPTDTAVDATNKKYGVPDVTYALNVLDGSDTTGYSGRPSDRLQANVVEGLTQTYNYDAIVYRSGSTIYARRADGTLISSGVFNTDDRFVIQQAMIAADAVVPKPWVVVIKPEVYKLTTTGSITPRNNTTVIGYGATIQSTIYEQTQFSVTNRQNVKIIGLTFDQNHVGDTSVFFGVSSTSTPAKDVLVKDCQFKNPKRPTVGNESTRFVFFSNNLADTMTDHQFYANNGNVIYNIFDNYITTEEGYLDTYSMINVGGWSNVHIYGNTFCSARASRRPLLLYAPSVDVRIINNMLYDNQTTHGDVIINQSLNCVFSGNNCSNAVEFNDVRGMVCVGNRMMRVDNADMDDVDFDENLSTYRGTHDVVIAYNSLNTDDPNAPHTIGREYAIFLNMNSNDDQPVRNYTIVGNQAKVYRNFVYMSGASATLSAPHESFLIANNQATERTLVDNTYSIINLKANATAPSGGLKNAYVIGNYCGPKTDGTAATHGDVGHGGAAGGTNFIVRDNFFKNAGISDGPDLYTTMSHNWGDATTRRHTNSGTTTVAGTATTVAVTHGVEYTPTAQDIYITPTSDWFSTTKWWISGITATQFTINASPAPGSGNNLTFAWQVDRRN